jgi:hypothetical protein
MKGKGMTFFVLQNALGSFIFIDNNGFKYPCDLLCQATFFESMKQAEKYSLGLIIRPLKMELL